MTRPRRRAPRDLRGARVLVTGATSGIGAATLDRLVAAGARVVATGRDRHALDAAVTAGAAGAVDADLTDGGAPAAVLERAVGLLGGLDAVVANAGAGWAGPFATMTAGEVAAVVRLDLQSTAELLLAATAPLTDPGDRPAGRVRGMVVVGSIAGLLPVAGEAVYSAAKAGAAALAEALRAELAPDGVTVSLVSPGVVDTAFFARRNVGYDRRFPTPIAADRVAAAVVDGLVTGRPSAIVPGWLRLPVAVRAVAPGAYRALAGHFG